MKTWNPTEGEVERKWWIVDATGLSLGRMSTEIARVLRGKHKPQFTPNADTGDFVIVINAEKVAMSGNKWATKTYYSHSGYFGHQREKSAEVMRQDDPTFIIEDAVKNMLPKNILSKSLITKLKSYKGADHPHAAQRPETLPMNHISKH